MIVATTREQARVSLGAMRRMGTVGGTRAASIEDIEVAKMSGSSRGRPS